MERDQLLERAALVEHRVVEAPDHDVRDVLEAVRAQEVAPGVRRERGERILADDTPVGQVAGALRAERDRAVALRADEEPADVRVLTQRRDELGMGASISSSVSRRRSDIR